jgi:hypothetical protein
MWMCSLLIGAPMARDATRTCAPPAAVPVLIPRARAPRPVGYAIEACIRQELLDDTSVAQQNGPDLTGIEKR